MRKTATITITDPGRDAGKIYILTEMPAMQAEKWAARALLALSKGGVEIPEDIANAGLAGVATLGMKAFGGMSFADAEPLMDEMFECVKIQPGENPNIVRALVESDIEEIMTRVSLRKAIFELHVNFSLPGVQSKSTPETPPAASKITEMSRGRSAPS
jgi:hypothetical protein